MLDRSNAPLIKEISKIQFEKPLVFDITKNNQMLCLTKVQDETAKLELYFDAGSIQGATEIASTVNSLLLSGTKTQNSNQINDEVNSLGGFIEQGISVETAVLSIYSLRENLIPIARIVKNAIQQCVFDKREMDQLIQTKKQKLSVNLEKVSVLARRAFRQRLFHNNQGYAQVTNVSDLEAINREQLIEFHEKYYLNGLQKMVLVGNFDQANIDELMDVFGSWANDKTTQYAHSFENIKGYAHLEKEEAVQTAIRIGAPLFNKTHPDYPDFIVLNTILGDYFGSRLMKNIREDKGYTYGIGSMVSEMTHTGAFMIGTEVKKEVKDLALAEIKYELDKLQQKLITDEELDLVKSYMLGQLLKSADGPYSMMDLYLSVQQYGLEFDFYNQFIQTINNMDAKRIQTLANHYLKWDNLTVVTAG